MRIKDLYSPRPDYSVCIVTYNSEKDIEECLGSVIENTGGRCDICVVDNASTDHTVEIIAESFSGITVIKNDTNRGFSAATNQAIAATRGEYVIMLNPDTIVHPLWADRMRAHMDAQPRVGAVGPMSTNCIGYQSIKTYNWAPEDVLANAGAYTQKDLLIGFCLMTRRRIIGEIGGLDELLFLGNDDLEFCWRLKVYGFKCILAHDAFIEHKLGQSFKSNSKSTELVQESTDQLYRKLDEYFNGNAPSGFTLWGIPWFKPSQGVIDECRNKRLAKNNI